MQIEIIDWGVGNISSLRWALKRLGISEGSTHPQARILPGVGSFGSAMSRIEKLEPNLPTLGICLGMQVFFKSSDEAPGRNGLGWIEGEVNRLPSKIVPHKGWNDGYWFDHSFFCQPTSRERVLRNFAYEKGKYPAVIRQDHLLGCQFHPEKSHEKGLYFLEEWIKSL